MESIKIVLVDDEVASRSIIKEYMEDSLNYEIVGDFSSGLDAGQWLKDNRVDIILCDMNMPQINGVEFIKMIKSIHNDIHFIAISAYDSFDYVHGCMVESVDDYLLKHELTREKLTEVLNRVVEKYSISSQKIQIKDRVGYYIKDSDDFAAAYIYPMIEKREINFVIDQLVPIVISIDYNSSLEQNKYKVVRAVSDILGQILGTKNMYIYTIDENDNIKLLLSFNNTKSSLTMKSNSYNLCKKLSKRVNMLLDTTITIGIGDICTSLDKAINQCNSLKEKLNDKFYLGDNRIIDNIEKRVVLDKSYSLPINIKKYLLYEIDALDDKTIARGLSGLFADVRNIKPGIKSVKDGVKQLLVSLSENNMLPDDIFEKSAKEINSIDTCFALEDFIIKIYADVVKNERERMFGDYSVTMKKIFQYIYTNYSDDISLDSCSDSVGLSYSHLSRLIKKETGKGFVEHLKRIRITKAKALIAKGDMSMKEIVSQVGFGNYNYFFKVFKEVEGVSPSEFIEKSKKV